MKTIQILKWLCVAISLSCVLYSYSSQGYWAVFLILPVMLLFGLVTNKRSFFWTISGLMVSYQAMAVIGIAIGIPPAVLLLGSLSSLWAWDLFLFSHNAVQQAFSADRLHVAKKHLESLSLTLISIPLMSLGLLVKMNLPFLPVLFMTIIVAVLLNLIIIVLKKI